MRSFPGRGQGGGGRLGGRGFFQVVGTAYANARRQVELLRDPADYSSGWEALRVVAGEESGEYDSGEWEGKGQFHRN